MADTVSSPTFLLIPPNSSDERQAIQKWESELQKLTLTHQDLKEGCLHIQEDGFQRYIGELNKIFAAASIIRLNLERTVKSFTELNGEGQNATMGIPEKREDLDLSVVETLKTNRKRGEEMIEASHVREEALTDDLRLLKQDVVNLSLSIKQGVTLSVAKERQINEMIATKESTIKQIEIETNMIVELRNNLVTTSNQIETAGEEDLSLELETIQLKDRIVAKKLEIRQEQRKKEKLEQDLRDQRVVVTIKSHEVSGKQDIVNRITEDISAIETQIRMQKQKAEKLGRDMDTLKVRASKMENEYSDKLQETQDLAAANTEKLKILELKEKELAHDKDEARKVIKIKEAFIRKNRTIEEEKIQADLYRKSILADNNIVALEIEMVKRKMQLGQNAIDDLRREISVLKTSLGKAQEETSSICAVLSSQNQLKRTYDLELIRSKQESQLNTNELIRSETALKASKDDADALMISIRTVTKEIKEKRVEIIGFQKQLMGTEGQLKHQQNFFEQVSSDRNLNAKKLLDSDLQIGEMKKHLSVINFQINGYKDDINTKEGACIKESEQNQRLKHDSDAIEREIATLKHQNTLASAYIFSQASEETKLDQFVKEAETELLRERCALQLLNNEKTQLKTQLTRRNDELVEVYSQIKSQQLNLYHGEVNYNDKIGELKRCHDSIIEKRKELAKTICKTNVIGELKRKLAYAQNQVNQEEMRVKVLRENLENPVNLHRWRKLEGSNPQVYEQLKFLQGLQKKLLEKSKEESAKQQEIEIKEQLYLHLKGIISKQVGPESMDHLNELAARLKAKRGQLRHMGTELNMYRAQVEEYKHSIGKYDAGLANNKKHFLRMYINQVKNSKSSKVNEAGRKPGSSPAHSFTGQTESYGSSPVQPYKTEFLNSPNVPSFNDASSKDTVGESNSHGINSADFIQSYNENFDVISTGKATQSVLKLDTTDKEEDLIPEQTQLDYGYQSPAFVRGSLSYLIQAQTINSDVNEGPDAAKSNPSINEGQIESRDALEYEGFVEVTASVSNSNERPDDAASHPNFNEETDADYHPQLIEEPEVSISQSELNKRPDAAESHSQLIEGFEVSESLPNLNGGLDASESYQQVSEGPNVPESLPILNEGLEVLESLSNLEERSEAAESHPNLNEGYEVSESLPNLNGGLDASESYQQVSEGPNVTDSLPILNEGLEVLESLSNLDEGSEGYLPNLNESLGLSGSDAVLNDTSGAQSSRPEQLD